jgi:hypothetical protein
MHSVRKWLPSQPHTRTLPKAGPEHPFSVLLLEKMGCTFPNEMHAKAHTNTSIKERLRGLLVANESSCCGNVGCHTNLPVALLWVGMLTQLCDRHKKLCPYFPNFAIRLLWPPFRSTFSTQLLTQHLTTVVFLSLTQKQYVSPKPTLNPKP